MISRENYGNEHIQELQAGRRTDIKIIERNLFAFGLLEALATVGLDFTFKGGTSLMLLLKKPMRLSTDIDIIVKPGTDVDSYLKKAYEIFPFKSGGEQYRKKRGNIEKRHFKFDYDSPLDNGEPFYILLDILFEENKYDTLTSREIKTEMLITEGENLSVIIPSIDCILADKMTAFAPRTTGIRLNDDKDLEIIKQFYDVCTLFDEFNDYGCVKRTYFPISETEIRYRELDITPRDALNDTINAAMCIGSRGKVSEEDFQTYVRACRDIRQHIYEPGFSTEKAAVMAPKVIYLAACLLTDQAFQRVTDPGDYLYERLSDEKMNTMKFIRRLDPVGYAYLVLADRLLNEHR